MLPPMVSAKDPGGLGDLSPFCLTNVAIFPLLAGLYSDASNLRLWSHHSLVGYCQIFPVPLQPKEHCTRGVACVKAKEGLQTK